MAHSNRRSRSLLAFCIASVASLSSVAAESWESTLTPFVPGSFPELRSVRTQYKFGWNNLAAATSELHFTHLGDGRARLEGNGGTIGMARALWKYDLKSSSICEAQTLRPIESKEFETLRKKTISTLVNFTSEKVTSHEEKRGTEVKIKDRSFDFPNVLSTSSAMLFLRSLPLADGAVVRMVVYPASAPYLCTITVLGREHVNGPNGSVEAIKLDVKLNKIGKGNELLPYKKFKRATVWLSNDPDRLALRIEAQVFIGTVFAELQSVQFDNAKP
jgi:hypothetical protein